MLCYRDGDAGAFDVLYGRHRGGVYRYFLRQCRDAAVAEELFQDVWMNLIRARAKASTPFGSSPFGARSEPFFLPLI